MLSRLGSQTEVNVQWVPGHCGLRGNEDADYEARRGATLPQTQSIDFSSARAAIARLCSKLEKKNYNDDPHSATHRACLANGIMRSQEMASREEEITLSQLRTGHSPRLAAYLHRIGKTESPNCPHCQNQEETLQHLVFDCPAH